MKSIFKNSVLSIFGVDLPLQSIKLNDNSVLGHFSTTFFIQDIKSKKINPDELLQKFKGYNIVFDKVTVLPNGFVNFYLTTEWIYQNFQDFQIHSDNPANHKKKVVIDYSSPNVAKPLHVGHLRSTLIGDALANMYEISGYDLVRQNHLGDWGTQFGMLLAYLEDNSLLAKEVDFDDWSLHYQNAKKKFEDDEIFKSKSYQKVLSLQKEDENTKEEYQVLVKSSKDALLSVYQELGISLTEKDFCGESFYNNILPGVVEKLLKSNIAKYDNNAVIVDVPGFQSPFLIKKSDGGFLYSTTDLAAIYYRLQILKADKVIYVVDNRQEEHFKKLFWIAEKMQWGSADQMFFVGFGVMLGSDNKPFKTRSGETFKLKSAIELVKNAAAKNVDQKYQNLSGDEKKMLEDGISFASIKYSDLSKVSKKDYVFNIEAMLATQGNTAMYIEYTLQRLDSLCKKLGDTNQQPNLKILPVEASVLMLELSMLPDVLSKGLEKQQVHLLTDYLYKCSTLFASLYAKEKFLGAENEKIYSLLCFKMKYIFTYTFKILGLPIMKSIEQEFIKG